MGVVRKKARKIVKRLRRRASGARGRASDRMAASANRAFDKVYGF